MKTKTKIIIGVSAVIVIIALVASIFWFSMPSEERNMISFMMLGGESYDNYQEYQVIDRNESALNPTGLNPVVAETSYDDYNVNVMSMTEMVKNENSKMLKKGMVQTTGIDDYTGWHMIADEGAEEGENPFGPSPLSYYTAGIATNLHTQIIRAAEVKGVELDNVKVEVLNKFYWDEMLSDDGAGFLDYTNTNIIIESSESLEVIQAIKEMALKSWTAGEALAGETVIDATMIVNGNDCDTYHATPGTSLSDESIVDGMKLSSVTNVPRTPEYLEQTSKDDVSDSFSFDTMSNLEFEIYAISESAENDKRPYLKKITLSTPSPETWEMYSDEFMGDNDKPIAPTSLEYFTLGTSLCLTSQMTLVSAMMGLDYNDYRVESQIDYRVENVKSEDMISFADTVHSYIIIESDESEERLNQFFQKSLSLCFAGEGLKGATEMNTKCYLNGKKIK